MLDPTTDKAIKIKALMSNPKTMNKIKQALSSPLGSAKRKNAASLLGWAGSRMAMPVMPMMDGQGGAPDKPLSLDASGRIIPSIVTGNSKLNIPTPTAKGSSLSVTTNPDGTLNNTNQNGALSQTLFLQPATIKTKPTVNPNISLDATGKISDIPAWLRTSNSNQTNVTTPPAPTGNVSIMDLPQSGTVSVLGETNAQGQIKDKQGNIITPITANQPTQSGGIIASPTTPANTLNQTSPSDLSEWEKLLYDATNKGVGRDTFVAGIMNNDADLKSYEKYLGLPEGSLPRGTIFANQIDDMKKRLKEETGLNALYDKLTTLQNEGVDLKKNLALQSTRDEYIGSLDKMIADTKNKLLDTDNYLVRKQLDKYLNYLYVTQGRESKAYTEYLNNGIDNYNKRLDALEKQYNVLEKNYNEMFSDEKDISKEQFTLLQKLLGDMYDNVSKRDQLALNKLKDKNDLAEEQARAAEIALNGAGSAGLSDTQKQDLKAFQQLSGVANMTSAEQNIILNSLTPAERTSFALALKTKLQQDPNVNILTYAEEWLREQETGGVPNF